MKIGQVWIICLIFFIIFSCTTNLKNKTKEQDLIKTFELKDKKFEKFKFIESKDKSIRDQKTESIVLSKNKIASVQTEKIEKKVSTSTKNKNLLLNHSSKEDISSENYPENYPEKFKNYDNKYREMWNKFVPKVFPGEEFHIVVKYLGITAGHIIIRTLETVSVAHNKVWHFKARLKSADYYKYFYQLDDSIESFVSRESFLPIKFQLIQRESLQEVDDLQIFDQERRKTHFWYKRKKRGKIKKTERSEFIPKFVQDSFSALYFARGLPLREGVEYEFPIVTRAKIWILKMEVIGKDVIEVDNKKIEALKIKAETRFPGVLKKKGDILFWFSNDERRIILKFEAKVKIGSISGRLLKYKK